MVSGGFIAQNVLPMKNGICGVYFRLSETYTTYNITLEITAYRESFFFFNPGPIPPLLINFTRFLLLCLFIVYHQNRRGG